MLSTPFPISILVKRNGLFLVALLNGSLFYQGREFINLLNIRYFGIYFNLKESQWNDYYLGVSIDKSGENVLYLAQRVP